MNNNTNPMQCESSSDLIDSVAFAISGTLPTTPEVRDTAKLVIKIVRGAAVNEAMVERAVAAALSAPSGISVEAYVRIVLEAALAQQGNK